MPTLWDNPEIQIGEQGWRSGESTRLPASYVG